MPPVRRMLCSAVPTSATIWASLKLGRCGWVSLWLPTTKPATATAFVSAGNDRTHCPVRKKVAGTFLSFRVCSIEGTASALAPASKVSATTGALVGMRVQSTPSRDGEGAGGGAIGHALDHNDDHVPLRCRSSHNALSVLRTTTSTRPAAPAAPGASISRPPRCCHPVDALLALR